MTNPTAGLSAFPSVRVEPEAPRWLRVWPAQGSTSTLDQVESVLFGDGAAAGALTAGAAVVVLLRRAPSAGERSDKS